MSQEKDLLELSTSHHFIQMSEVYSTHFQFLFLYSYTSPEKLCMILHTSKQYFFISAPGYICVKQAILAPLPALTQSFF